MEEVEKKGTTQLNLSTPGCPHYKWKRSRVVSKELRDFWERRYYFKHKFLKLVFLSYPKFLNQCYHNLVESVTCKKKKSSVFYKGMGFLSSSAGKDSAWKKKKKDSACNAGDLGLIPGWGSSLGEGIGCPLSNSWASLVIQTVKNPPAMWETWVWSPGW